MSPPGFEAMLNRVRAEYSTTANGDLKPRGGRSGRSQFPPSVDMVVRVRLAHPDVPVTELALMLGAQSSTVCRRLRTARGEDEVIRQWLRGYGLSAAEAAVVVEEGRRRVSRELEVDDAVPLGGGVSRRTCSWCEEDATCIELDRDVGAICTDCLRTYLRALEVKRLVDDAPVVRAVKTAHRRPRLQPVLTATPTRGPQGGRRYRVELECGHRVTRRAQQGRAPKAVKCERCASEARRRQAGVS